MPATMSLPPPPPPYSSHPVIHCMALDGSMEEEDVGEWETGFVRVHSVGGTMTVSSVWIGMMDGKEIVEKVSVVLSEMIKKKDIRVLDLCVKLMENNFLLSTVGKNDEKSKLFFCMSGVSNKGFELVYRAVKDTCTV
jgi:hypothetical protein